MAENTQNNEILNAETPEKTKNSPETVGEMNSDVKNSEHKTATEAQTFENVFPLKPDDPNWEEKKKFLRSNLSEAFKCLVPGMSMTVTRTRPSWCARYIETVPVDVDEFGNTNIDMDFMRETYGGDSLSLKFLNENGKFVFGTMVHFRGVPPRENGVELEHPDVKLSREKFELERRQERERQNSANDKLFETMLNMQNQNFQNMIAMFRENQDSKTPTNQMDEMLRTFERLDKLRTPVQPQIDGDGVSGMLAGLAQMFMAKGMQPQQAPQQFSQPSGPPRQSVQMPMTAMPMDNSQTKISNPTCEPGSQVRIPACEPGSQVPPSITEAENDDDEADIVDALAGMENDDLAETLSDLMDELGQERTARIFQKLGELANEAKQADNNGETNTD